MRVGEAKSPVNNYQQNSDFAQNAFVSAAKQFKKPASPDLGKDEYYALTKEGTLSLLKKGISEDTLMKDFCSSTNEAKASYQEYVNFVTSNNWLSIRLDIIAFESVKNSGLSFEDYEKKLFFEITQNKKKFFSAVDNDLSHSEIRFIIFNKIKKLKEDIKTAKKEFSTFDKKIKTLTPEQKNQYLLLTKKIDDLKSELLNLKSDYDARYLSDPRNLPPEPSPSSETYGAGAGG